MDLPVGKDVHESDHSGILLGGIKKRFIRTRLEVV
jgi:hypothetical protein